MAPTTVERSVFINCPFDRRFQPLLRAIVFTVYDCGFVPRSALEVEDGSPRLEKIERIIEESGLGIHDLSRAGINQQSGLARFNMPLELGLFLGAKRFGSKTQKAKALAIFDKEKYRYQKFISDLSGYDVWAHNEEAERIIANTRNFLANHRYGDFQIPGARRITSRFLSLGKSLPSLSHQLGSLVSELTFRDYCRIVEAYLEKNYVP